MGRTGEYPPFLHDLFSLFFSLKFYSAWHRPEDRKISLHADFKNFIHNYEPSGMPCLSSAEPLFPFNSNLFHLGVPIRVVI